MYPNLNKDARGTHFFNKFLELAYSGRVLILISVLISVAAIFSWISTRLLRLPNTIGTMLLTVVSSIALVLLAPVWPNPHDVALHIIRQIDFERLILHGMLSLLLFAGASLLDLEALLEQKLTISLLAILATVLSIALVGGLTFYAAALVGYPCSLLEAVLFGALISPTDPIAVLEMLQRVATPRYLKAQMAGESLFNDGVGAVIFLGLISATHGATPTIPHLLMEILFAAGGGILLGTGLAFPIALLVRNVESPLVDILLSLALALGGYAIADHFSFSAPLETVTAALALRLLTERKNPDSVAHIELNRFWNILDEIQNSVIFVLLGCGFLVINFHRQAVYLGLSEIVLVNLARIASVALVLMILRVIQPQQKSSITILTWGGLRGGLSIALALSVPPGFGGGGILTITYLVVVFSILVQGSTMGVFLKRRLGRAKKTANLRTADL
jgi:CPA1 family monovalent cation:H+ antiporter